MELVVAQAALCQSVSGWHVHAAAKGARDPEAHVVEQDHHDIRCTRWRVQYRLLRGVGTSRVEGYGLPKRLIGDGKNLASYFDILCHARLLLPSFLRVVCSYELCRSPASPRQRASRSRSLADLRRASAATR